MRRTRIQTSLRCGISSSKFVTASRSILWQKQTTCLPVLNQLKNEYTRCLPRQSPAAARRRRVCRIRTYCQLTFQLLNDSTSQPLMKDNVDISAVEDHDGIL